MIDQTTGLSPTLKQYRAYVTMKAGYADIFHHPNGYKQCEPKSIAFGRMSQETFEELYERVFQVIIYDIQADKEILRNELAGF